MKRILVLLMLFIAAGVCYADEVELENKQVIDVENSGGMILVQKQPVYQSQFQVIKVRKTGGIFLIQINGKIKDTDNTVRDRR